jgi:hypothetical protein
MARIEITALKRRLRRLVRWLWTVVGKRDWVTLEEFDGPISMLNKDGSTGKLPCVWRDQRCRLTGRIRRQSNFGHGWITEAECPPNVEVAREAGEKDHE